MANNPEKSNGGTVYSLSKGPKSLYPDIDNVVSVILNVPQTDTDDEWGGTERIAMERVVDYIGALVVEVDDPANGGIGGIKSRLANIIGDTVKSLSITYPFIDMSVPSLTMGTVVISGLNNDIRIGTTTIFASKSLTFDAAGGSPFTIGFSTIPPDNWELKYATNTIKLIKGSTADSVKISVGTTDYIFDGTKFSTTEIYADTISSANFGSSGATSYTFQNLYVFDTTSNIGTASSSGRVNNIFVKSFNLDATGTTMSVDGSGFSFFGTLATFTSALTVTGVVTGGSFVTTGAATVGSVSTTGAITAGSVTATGNIGASYFYGTNCEISNTLTVYGAINPGSSNTVDLGSSGNYFRALHINSINLQGASGRILSSSEIQITAATDLKLSGAALITSNFTTMSLMASTSLSLTAPTVNITAATAFNVISPSINFDNAITVGAAIANPDDPVLIDGSGGMGAIGSAVSPFYNVYSSRYYIPQVTGDSSYAGSLTGSVYPTYFQSYTTLSSKHIVIKGLGGSGGGDTEPGLFLDSASIQMVGQVNIIGSSNGLTSVGRISGTTYIQAGTYVHAGSYVQAGTDIYTIPMTNCSDSTTVFGWSSTTVITAYYKKIGKKLYFDFRVAGTAVGGSGNVTAIKLPEACINPSAPYEYRVICPVAASTQTSPVMGYISGGLFWLGVPVIFLYTNWNFNVSFPIGTALNVIGSVCYETV